MNKFIVLFKWTFFIISICGNVFAGAPDIGMFTNYSISSNYEYTDGSGRVKIYYKVRDAEDDICFLTNLEFSTDNKNTWITIDTNFVTGNISAITSSNSFSNAPEQSFIWKTTNYLKDWEGVCYFRFKAGDGIYIYVIKFNGRIYRGTIVLVR